jgi:sec-independent protein translocase protein TatB
MFDVGIWEILVIVVVGIVVFGPDRLPEYARQAGRMARQLRKFAQSAQQDLRDELGPEYADLKLSDLDPRVAIRKHILESLDEDDLDPTGKPVERATRPVLGPDERPPYDLEAT